MRRILLPLVILLTTQITAQVARIVTSPSTISSLVPGYTQVSTINTKTVNFTPPTAPTDPTPIDEDSTKEINKKLWYADLLTTSISNSDGNVTSTSLGKVWTLKIVVPQALNIRLNFSQFNLSTAAKMYIFNNERTQIDTTYTKSEKMQFEDPDVPSASVYDRVVSGVIQQYVKHDSGIKTDKPLLSPLRVA